MNELLARLLQIYSVPGRADNARETAAVACREILQRADNCCYAGFHPCVGPSDLYPIPEDLRVMLEEAFSAASVTATIASLETTFGSLFSRSEALAAQGRLVSEA